MMKVHNWWKVYGGTVEKYILLTLLGCVLFAVLNKVAYAERGYPAVGGEGFALLLPVFYWLISRSVNDGRSEKHER